MSVATVYVMFRPIKLVEMLKHKQPRRQLPAEQLTTAEKEAIGTAQKQLDMQEIAAKFGKFPPKQAQSAVNLVGAFKTGDFSSNNLVLFTKLGPELRLLIHEQLNKGERERFNAAMYNLERQQKNQ